MKNLHLVSLLILSLFLLPRAFAQQLTVTWDNNAPTATGTAVERAPGLAATSGFVEVIRLPVPAISYVDKAVVASTAYTYRLRAFNTGGFSDYSPTASGTTLPAPPPSPSGIRVSSPAPVVTVSLQSGQQVTVVAR